MNIEPLAAIASVRGLVGGPFGSSLVSKDYVEDGVPVIRGNNMGFGRYLGGEFAFVSPEKFERDLARNTAEPGDIVYTQRGTLGQVSIVPADSYERYVVSQSQMRLRVDESKAVPKYVYYASLTRSFLAQIDDRAISTGVPHTNLGILGGLEIPVPSLAEQQAIAEVLGALDDKIAANTELATTADELASVMVGAALTGERVPLSELAEIVMGSSPRGDDLNDSGDGLPFYQGVRDFGMRFPTRRVFTTAPVRTAAAGDLLVSVRAPVGDLNCADEDLCIGRGLAAVRSKLGRQATLFHQLRADQSAWQPFQSEGTVFASINKAQLHGLELRTVDSTSATRLEVAVGSLEAQIAGLLQENRTLAATRDALLPQLMSGKLRVRHAEDTVAALGV